MKKEDSKPATSTKFKKGELYRFTFFIACTPRYMLVWQGFTGFATDVIVDFYWQFFS